MTPLRQLMFDDMKLRNLAAGTRLSYMRSVANFSLFHERLLAAVSRPTEGDGKWLGSHGAQPRSSIGA